MGVAVQSALVRYDRTGDQHYDVISAFIKSVRGSDVDAALHYLARMIEAGEDPRFIARRLVILASEDIGLADPSALGVATAAMTSSAQIGLPEARLPLAQATIHLALAPKSNAVVRAIDAAQADVRAGLVGQVPAHLRDGHYPNAATLGVVGYRYPHDDPSGVMAQQYAPDPVVGRHYYEPGGHGVEARLGDVLARLRAALSGEGPDGRDSGRFLIRPGPRSIRSPPMGRIRVRAMSRTFWMVVGAVGGVVAYRKGTQAAARAKELGPLGSAQVAAQTTSKLAGRTANGLGRLQDVKARREGRLLTGTAQEVTSGPPPEDWVPAPATTSAKTRTSTP